jgi:hypothetical protein
VRNRHNVGGRVAVRHGTGGVLAPSPEKRTELQVEEDYCDMKKRQCRVCVHCTRETRRETARRRGAEAAAVLKPPFPIALRCCTG